MTGRRIRTDRLVLELLTRALARAIVAGDLSGLRPGSGWPHPDTVDGLRGLAEYGGDDHAGGWLVTLAGDGTVIGDAGTHGGPDPDGDVEIGYGIAPPYRGRGYAGEAVAGMIGALGDRPDVRRLSAAVLADNVASRRLLERRGFAIDRVAAPHVYYLLTL